MSYDPTLVADALVNLFAAIGALALAREVHRADPLGSVTQRIKLALRFVGTLFLVRAIAWTGGDQLSLNVADVLAAATPLVALLVAEGLLRRHGPLPLKLALAAAPLLLVLVKLAPLVPIEAQVVALALLVLGGFAAVAALLWQRDPATLTSAENANVRRVLLAVLVLVPMILTDFRSLWPEVPVRLGAVGALLLLYLGFGVGNVHASDLARGGTIAMFAAISVLFAYGYAAANGGGEAAQVMRVAAVGFSGLLLAAIWCEARGAWSERSRPGGSLLAAGTPRDFEAALREHPLLGGARILEADMLSHARHAGLDDLLAQAPVLRRSAAPWGRASTDDGVERALSLMTAYEATDLVVITRSPLRLLALSVPAIARDARSEADIQLARLVGEIAFTKADRP